MSQAPRAITAAIFAVTTLLPVFVSAGSPPSHAGNGAMCGTGVPAHADPRNGHFQLSFTAVGRDGTRSRGTWFQANRVSDVLLVVSSRRTGGGHTQRLDVFAPDGAVYQRFTAPIDRDGHVETRLPIAGTWIVQYGMYGQWCVELYLDDGARPIARGRFFLEPGT